MAEYVEPYVSDVQEDENKYEEEHVYANVDGGSDPVRQRRASPPVSEASNAAMSDRSESISISNLSPELLAQITENVKRQVVEALKQGGTIDSSKADQLKSEPLMRDVPSRKTARAASPTPAARKTYNASPDRNMRDRKRDHSSSPSPSLHRRQVSQSPPEKPSARFSDRTRDDTLHEPVSRPVIPKTFSTAELGIVDQKWGKLFDDDMKPLPRLGQILRGVANHIIEEFEPKKSIVIAPNKMADFYRRYALDNEVHDFLAIFTTDSPAYTSQLYRELACAHHLVSPISASNAPTIPALTPAGFAQWMTHFLLAYPQQEHVRLEKVFVDLPIDADGPLIDNKPERLPKQMSRYLLPNVEDKYFKTGVLMAIDNFMEDAEPWRVRKSNEFGSPISRQTSHAVSVDQPDHRPRPMDIPPLSKPIERERMPYVNKPTVSDSLPDDESPSVKIERDRQPYTAMPGAGKVYVPTGTGTTTTVNNNTTTSKPSRHDARSSRTDTRFDMDELQEKEFDLPDRNATSYGSHARSGSNVSAAREAYTPASHKTSRRVGSPKPIGLNSSTSAHVNTSHDSNDSRHVPSYITPDSSSISDVTESATNTTQSRSYPSSSTNAPLPSQGSHHQAHSAQPPVVVDHRTSRDTGTGTIRERDHDNSDSGVNDATIIPGASRHRAGSVRETNYTYARDRDGDRDREDDSRRYPASSRARRDTVDEEYTLSNRPKATNDESALRGRDDRYDVPRDMAGDREYREYRDKDRERERERDGYRDSNRDRDRDRDTYAAEDRERDGEKTRERSRLDDDEDQEEYYYRGAPAIAAAVPRDEYRRY